MGKVGGQEAHPRKEAIVVIQREFPAPHRRRTGRKWAIPHIAGLALGCGGRRQYRQMADNGTKPMVLGQMSKKTVSFSPWTRMSNRYTGVSPRISLWATRVPRRSAGTSVRMGSFAF